MVLDLYREDIQKVLAGQSNWLESNVEALCSIRQFAFSLLLLRFRKGSYNNVCFVGHPRLGAKKSISITSKVFSANYVLRWDRSPGVRNKKFPGCSEYGDASFSLYVLLSPENFYSFTEVKGCSTTHLFFPDFLLLSFWCKNWDITSFLSTSRFEESRNKIFLSSLNLPSVTPLILCSWRMYVGMQNVLGN